MTLAKAKTYYQFAGVTMHCLLTARETGGGFSLFENRSPGASATPVHVHELEDETIYVLEGEMEAVMDGHTHVLKAGEALFMPRGTPHQLKNESGALSRYSILCVPSGFEDFVAATGKEIAGDQPPTPPSATEIAAMREAAPRFGITLLPGFARS